MRNGQRVDMRVKVKLQLKLDKAISFICRNGPTIYAGEVNHLDQHKLAAQTCPLHNWLSPPTGLQLLLPPYSFTLRRRIMSHDHSEEIRHEVVNAATKTGYCTGICCCWTLSAHKHVGFPFALMLIPPSSSHTLHIYAVQLRGQNRGRGNCRMCMKHFS